MWGSRLGYSIWMMVAAVVAGWILSRHQSGLKLSLSDRWTLAISGVVGATLAAKLPFLIFAQPLDSVWATWLADGKTVLWALVGGYVGVEVGKWMLGIRIRTGDTFVVAVAVAIAIGRLGCLFYGCCHGIPTDLPWGVQFPIATDSGLLRRHPTQIYESIFHLGFAVLAWSAIRRRILPGDWMPIYLACYAIFRFLSEWLRPELPLLAGLTFYQLSAIPIAAMMFGLVLRRHVLHVCQ
jgi:phosphatidylglycerol---prolipoprotein diacylglyceryl transferase